ncbi:Succinylglutamate desuccinylase / Aspartoacylase family protein [Halogranum amylolyticum]|uniref:Succinylglutamate desuccinylase / Aspartoacylase family protein n=1 Tax=Halogranum amylolyticum TaxID=660520 RepID=A0A1H8SMZ7_9EURY|nr:succinylglutamate desuccinylase/aspartoacylase family protein [Halogranum amylolyticum]SEO79886.1 Succinylglutamate desuccinylase / Aspartoacylase family protein [Halogranum amylolyticum]
MRRRTFLERATATLGGVAAAVGVTGTVSATQNEPRVAERTTSTLLAGTPYETETVTVDAPEDGPTAFVVGGMHGDEPSGYRAATDVASWDIRAGRIVAVPKANRPAIQRNTRKNDNGDFNRQFPPGSEPNTELARALWGLVADTDPDVVLDLHSSKGIYRTHESFVGQVVFPSSVDPAPGHAREAVDTVNGRVVPWYMPYHRYKHGNLVDGDAPLLMHKVTADLGKPGYLIESTKFLLDPRTAAHWTASLAEQLLASHGIERREGGDAR